MLDTKKAAKVAKRAQKKALAATRAATHDFADEVSPLTDKALAIGSTALTAAATYAKSIGSLKAGQWALRFARRNPVVLGVTLLGAAGLTVFAMTRPKSEA